MGDGLRTLLLPQQGRLVDIFLEGGENMDLQRFVVLREPGFQVLLKLPLIIAETNDVRGGLFRMW